MMNNVMAVTLPITGLSLGSLFTLLGDLGWELP